MAKHQDAVPSLIMIIDDDGDGASYLARLLRHTGLDTVIHHCGEDGLERMDARYLTQEDRDKLKLAVCKRRDDVGEMIRRMEAKHWFTDDGTYQSLKAAYHALHAAVQSLAALNGEPVRKFQAGPRYPLE